MLKYLEQHYEHKKQVGVARAAIEEEIKKRKDRIGRAEQQIKKLEKKLERDEFYASWYDDIVVPLMHELEKIAGDEWHGEIYGPFGICCETSIYLKKDTNKSITKQATYGLTIYPPKGDGVIEYLTNKTTNRYPPGSLGELNGENFIREILPDEIDEIWKLMQYIEEE